MSQRQALELALEFCEFLWRDVAMNQYTEEYRNRVEDAIRVALSEPEPGSYHGWVTREVLFDNGEPIGHREPTQEPVAKVELMTTGGNAGLATRIVEIDDPLRERLRPGQMLYTHPAPQRQPLTEYEAWEIWDALADRGKKSEDIVHAFARAVKQQEKSFMGQFQAARQEVAQLRSWMGESAKVATLTFPTPRTHPAPVRQPLTEEAIKSCERHMKVFGATPFEQLVYFARAIERAHGIGVQDE